MACPHCNTPATQRTARSLSSLVREVTYRCDNDACGHGFVVQIEAIRTTIPSAAPNPDIHLPFAAPARKMASGSLRPANDDHRTPANDDDAPPRSTATTPMTG
ncbi:transcriptional regulator [Sphingomonas oligophenolica]|uniref:Transcriptional regulator n=2 Tax=Sphingomonas oligophenolica TaxID=301154 RepID=A0A502CL50_9SPHN|nr:transcriptional regulator [Sphingomonas oligophenolica]